MSSPLDAPSGVVGCTAIAGSSIFCFSGVTLPEAVDTDPVALSCRLNGVMFGRDAVCERVRVVLVDAATE